MAGVICVLRLGARVDGEGYFWGFSGRRAWVAAVRRFRRCRAVPRMGGVEPQIIFAFLLTSLLTSSCCLGYIR